MSIYSVYESDEPGQRVEFTPGATVQAEEKTAASWFGRLQAEGLIPKNARLGHRIIGYQSPDSRADSPAPIPTYRKALTALIKELKANDTDRDGLADFNLEYFIRTLSERGIISNGGLTPQLARKALTTRGSFRQLKFYPPELTPYCDERSFRQIHFGRTGLSTRFAGEPLKMRDAISYFRVFAKIHTEKELRGEIEAYLKTYFLHADQTPLEGVNVSEDLGIDRNSDLRNYFTTSQGRALVDCNIFAEVANLILGSLETKGLSTSFVRVKFFDREKGHVALVVKKDGKPTWLVNNSTITEFSGGPDELVRTFTEDYYYLSQSYLVSWICQANTLARACAAPVQSDPEQALLHSPHASIRLNAAIFLSKKPDPDASGTLSRALLEEGNPKTRFYAALALAGSLQEAGEITPDQQISLEQIRVNLAKEQDPQVRVEILRILYTAGLIDQPQYVEGLKEALDRFAERYPNNNSYDCKYNDVRYCDREAVLRKVTSLLFAEGEPGLEMLGRIYDQPELYAKGKLKFIMTARLLAPIFGIDMGSPDLSKVKAPEIAILGLLKKALCQGKEYSAAHGLGILARDGNQQAEAILLEARQHPDPQVAALAAEALEPDDNSWLNFAPDGGE